MSGVGRASRAARALGQLDEEVATRGDRPARDGTRAAEITARGVVGDLVAGQVERAGAVLTSSTEVVGEGGTGLPPPPRLIDHDLRRRGLRGWGGRTRGQRLAPAAKAKRLDEGRRMDGRWVGNDDSWAVAVRTGMSGVRIWTAQEVNRGSANAPPVPWGDSPGLGRVANVYRMGPSSSWTTVRKRWWRS